MNTLQSHLDSIQEWNVFLMDIFPTEEDLELQFVVTFPRLHWEPHTCLWFASLTSSCKPAEKVLNLQGASSAQSGSADTAGKVFANFNDSDPEAPGNTKDQNVFKSTQDAERAPAGHHQASGLEREKDSASELSQDDKVCCAQCYCCS